MRAEGGAGSFARPAAAVFLVSLGVLTTEIALMRILSFTLWYHFSYVVISVALLGYGASGAVLASSGRLAGVPPGRRISGACLAAALGATLALLAIRFLRFQPLEVGTHLGQMLLMTGYLLAVAVPFFAAGLVISSALAGWRRGTTVIYFADLAGAGLGCALAIPAIWWFGAPGAVASGAVLLAGGGVVMAPRQDLRRVAPAALVAGALAFGAASGLDFKPSADKAMALFMEKGVAPIFSRWSPIFRVDVYEPRIPGGRRGTSHHFEGEIPGRRFIAHDGGAEAAMYRFSGDLRELEFLSWNIASAPYQILERPEVLIIGLGGGFDVLTALAGRAEHITGVELDPVTVEIVRERSRGFSGGILDRRDVSAVVAEGRSFLRRSDHRYDLIQLTGVDTLAALSSGAYVLSESYLYTAESMVDYLSHLTPRGVLSFMISDLSLSEYRARFAPRHVANFVAAARKLGIGNPAARAVVMGTKGDVPMLELMFKRTPFAPREVRALKRFASDRGFRIFAAPGTRTGSSLEVLLGRNEAARKRLLRAYPLDVSETTDDRPFFFQSYRWRDLFGVSSEDLDTGHAGATGQIILAVLLGFTVLASVALILVPLVVSHGLPLRTRGALRFALYFGGLGLGFMLLEISLIQRFVLFLGHPTYAIATILAALLVSTGVGSFVSGRVRLPPRRLLLPALAVAMAIASAYLNYLPALFDAALGAPLGARAAIAVALLAPLGLTLGVFFPSGLRIVQERHPRFVPWAWGVNGGASVVGTILAILIAMGWGFPAVTLAGFAAYGVGVIAMLSVGSDSTAS